MLVGIVIDILNLLSYLPFLKPDEKDVENNVKQLSRYDWFQNLLDHEEYRNLIIHDRHVRKQIGSFSRKKMHCKTYIANCHMKLLNILLSKSSRKA